MNYWVEFMEKPQKVLNNKVFKPISVSSPLPSGVTRGWTRCSEISLDPPGSQPKKETKEEELCFCFSFLSQTSMTLCGMLQPKIPNLLLYLGAVAWWENVRWSKQIQKAPSCQTWVFTVFDCKLPKNKDCVLYMLNQHSVDTKRILNDNILL